MQARYIWVHDPDAQSSCKFRVGSKLSALDLSRETSILSRLDQRSLSELTDDLYRVQAKEPVFIWTINLSHLREYSKNNLEFDFLNSNCLMVADGWPIRTLSNLLAKRQVERIPGVDIVEVLLRKGINFSVIGSSKEQLDGALSRNSISSQSHLDYYFDQMIDLKNEFNVSAIRELITRKPTKFVFLALGFPKQELLFDLLNSKWNLSPGYYLGIGGTFEMLSGEKIRAPKWIQNLGLEWSWRFLQDPKRLFHRYFLDSVFLISVILRIPISKMLDKVR